MPDRPRPMRVRKDMPADPELRTVTFRMSVGAPYVIMVDPPQAREVINNLSDYWDGDVEIGAPRVLNPDGQGFILNPAHIVAVDVR